MCPICGRGTIAKVDAATPDRTPPHAGAGVWKGAAAVMIVLALVIGIAWVAFLKGGGHPASGSAGSSTGNSGGQYSDQEVAEALLDAFYPNRTADSPVTVTCEAARRAAGSISDCTTQWEGGTPDTYRVVFADDQGHFTATCSCRNAYGEQITHDGSVR